MRILFIKPKHIGDSLILTPTLAATRHAYPQAEIWVAVRQGCEGILTGCPAINHVLTLAPVERANRSRSNFGREILQLLHLTRIKFDYLFELGDGHRARWFTLFCRAAKKYSVKTGGPLNHFWTRQFTGISTFDWVRCHRVEKDFYSVHEFLPLSLPIPPLMFEPSRTRVWPGGAVLKDFAVLQIGTRQKVNQWHYAGWRDVGRLLLQRFRDLVISTGPSAEEVAEAKRLSADLGGKPVCTLGQTSWGELADLLYRARLYVGPPTAAMHLAAACQCPTVSLFGPTIEDNWHPWLAPYRIVIPPGTPSTTVNSQESKARFAAIKRRVTQEIRASDVIAACESITVKSQP